MNRHTNTKTQEEATHKTIVGLFRAIVQSHDMWGLSTVPLTVIIRLGSAW